MRFQAPSSTVSLETRASKHPIEQPPQPLDRLSLDLQNPERSSSLEAPRALTRHWSSRLSCPRATTRGRATTISEIVVPGIYSDQDHHQQIDRLPIYCCTVEKPPSEKQRASTRRRKCPATMFTRLVPPHLSKLRTGASQLRFKKMAPRFGLLGGRSTIWRWKRLHRRLHAPPRAGEASVTFSTRQHAEACARHTLSCFWHTPVPRVASLCHCVSP
uniref:Uncharacterized protein n=1 Tax=Fagus sylvatica TaxID=28930 RepID=A0A2N9IRR1_FAGSY